MISSRLVSFLLGVMLVIAAPITIGAQPVSLRVDVQGANPDQGQIILSVFASADDFLNKALVSSTKVVGNTGKVRFNIDDLPPGRYALSAVYDQDSNGKLNTGWFGIPNEAVGFSNRARAKFGPPTFEAASLLLV